MPQLLLFTGQVIAGVGQSLYYTLGVAYIDDNVKKSKTPALISTINFLINFYVINFILRFLILPTSSRPSRRLCSCELLFKNIHFTGFNAYNR
jgi:hypothetical protein